MPPVRCTTAPPSNPPLSHMCPLPRPEMLALEAYAEGTRGAPGFHSLLISPPWCRDVLVYQTERGLCSCLCLLGKEWRAAFVCHYSHPEHPGMPFGLCQSPATLQRSVTTVFCDVLDSCVTAYTGDTSSLLRHAKEHVVPLRRFSPAFTLICLQSWRPAFLRQLLDFWGARWAPLLYFLSTKFHCIPPSLLCTWVLRCCHAALIAGHSGHREALHRVMQSYWWPMVPADVPSYARACYARTRAKKPMQRLSAGVSHSRYQCLSRYTQLCQGTLFYLCF